MFDELDNDSNFDPASVNTNTEQRSYSNSNNGGNGGGQQQQQQRQGGYQGGGGGYGNRQGGGGSGGYGGRQGGGGGGFKKEDVVSDPYLPITVYVEQDFPENVKEALYQLASKLIGKRYTVRVSGIDKQFAERVMKLSDSKVELYLPWRNFNEMDSKHTFNTLTSKHVASLHFAGWEKVPDAIKAFLAMQVRMVMGDRNNSATMCVITWSPDGASKHAEVTKDTGRSGFMIKMSSNYGFPVVNTQKQSSEVIIEKNFGL